MNKRIICTALVIALILSGCKTIPGNRKESTKDSVRIGISIYDGYDTFIDDMVKEISDYSKKKEKETGITILLDVVSANGSQLNQNDQVAKFIDKKYDVVAVNLVDRTDATVIIDKAKNASVPVVFFNREPVIEDLNRWDGLFYIGANAEQSGMLQAEIVNKALGNPIRYKEIDKNGDGIIQYIILEGETGHQDALIRTQVSIEGIQKAGFLIERLGDEIANWNRSQAMSKMNLLLEEYPTEIEMVLANDDDMALGAIDAYDSRDLELPLIVGINGTDEALEAIKMKRMEGTVYNDAKGQAEAILEHALNLATSDNVSSLYSFDENRALYVDYKLIEYENVQEFVRLKEK